ncbi:hypothetical protein C8F01DRAFT_1331307 [Mycena amicta]|nr:hypothetical protein C8F01DRAFT_1331307 [Mycena amicta]
MRHPDIARRLNSLPMPLQTYGKDGCIVHPEFDPKHLSRLPMPLKKLAKAVCQDDASDADTHRFSHYALNASWTSLLPVYWQSLDPARIPHVDSTSIEDAWKPNWPLRNQLLVAVGAINALLLNRPPSDPRRTRADTDSVEYALWHRLFPWMLFLQRYHSLLPPVFRATPQLKTFLPFLHFTMEVFQPLGHELTELYLGRPGLTSLLFHTWTLLVEDGVVEDELGYRALIVLLPQTFPESIAAEAIEGAGGTLQDVATLVANHIRVFAPRISRRVPGPERLLPIGIHLGVFHTVLMTTNALSRVYIGPRTSSGDNYLDPFLRLLGPALSIVALTRSIVELSKIAASMDVGAQMSVWDSALNETLSLLSTTLCFQRSRQCTSSALRNGLVPALARCCQRPLSDRTAKKVASFIAEVLQPATMLRSLARYLEKDREAVLILVKETRAVGETAGPRIMDVWRVWCDIVERHLVLLQLPKERDVAPTMNPVPIFDNVQAALRGYTVLADARKKIGRSRIALVVSRPGPCVYLSSTHSPQATFARSNAFFTATTF